MHYIDRLDACRILGIRPITSYKFLSAAHCGKLGRRTHLVRDDDVLSLLYKSRNRNQPFLDFLPHELQSADDIERETGIPVRIVLRLARRNKNPIPAFCISSHTIRFRLDDAIRWLTEPRRVRRKALKSMKPLNISEKHHDGENRHTQTPIGVRSCD